MNDFPDKAAEEILAMAAADLALRSELAASGALFDGYHPQMRALHEANAEALDEIVAAHGWPEGEAGEAAWLIAQHAISRPDLQRRGLAALRASGAPASRVAMLEDRIRVLEGRPQLYGTQFDWGSSGRLEPNEIEDADGVDVRRAAVGLPPLAQAAAELNARAAAEGDRAPADAAARRAAYEAFLREVGWRV